MAKAKSKVGRPSVLGEEDVVYLAGRKATVKLQSASDRRALINRIIDLGGKAKIRDLNVAFGFDVRALVLSLARSRWVEIGDPEAE